MGDSKFKRWLPNMCSLCKPRLLHHDKSWNYYSTFTSIAEDNRPRSSMFKRRLIAADQASVLNVQMTFEQRSSSLVLHQMTSDHNRSELGIQVHSNEQSSSKLVPKVVP
ncbi:hypothetical protein Tco_0856585 [Tanacetum coccineum]|uniref:Uncharacterized protein n=1 Tax=Tanacetum coccineum TaxID=301880 RepID=A0ABQ5B7P2_9ASTR